MNSGNKSFDIRQLNRMLSLILAALILVSVIVWENGSRRSYKGIGDPIQKELSGKAAASSVIKREVGGWDVSIDRLYSYDIEALVLHTHNYIGLSVDKLLGPRDLALAWGVVAEYNEESGIKWSQANRWYRYECRDLSMYERMGELDGISSHSANTHCVPADSEVLRKLFLIRTGERVRMKGYLVNISGEKSDGSTFSWNSSVSREDTGDGACEVFYIEEIEWIDY